MRLKKNSDGLMFCQICNPDSAFVRDDARPYNEKMKDLDPRIGRGMICARCKKRKSYFNLDGKEMTHFGYCYHCWEYFRKHGFPSHITADYARRGTRPH